MDEDAAKYRSTLHPAFRLDFLWILFLKGSSVLSIWALRKLYVYVYQKPSESKLTLGVVIGD
jgi:hypothetical protein